MRPNRELGSSGTTTLYREDDPEAFPAGLSGSVRSNAIAVQLDAPVEAVRPHRHCSCGHKPGPVGELIC